MNSSPVHKSADADTPVHSSVNARLWLIGAFSIFSALWILDFYLDVRTRDAFTWMDPFQYFTYAYDYVYENRGFNTFDLPSIFPFFIALPLTLSATVAGALSVNLVFLILLLIGVYTLCVQYHIRPYSPLVALAVLSSPLLMGLSRSLYIEFSLSAMVAIQYAVWIETRSFTQKSWTIFFAFFLAAGFMMKMTYPIYLAGPLAVEILRAALHKKWKCLTTMVAVFALPIIMVLGIEYAIFPRSFGYYLSLGNTRIPIMRLIGPTGLFSMDALGYYFTHVWKTMLYLLAPLLLASIGLARRRNAEPGRGSIWLLWVWFVTPLILLAFQEVKEPRHAAPCVVPGVLLLFCSLPWIRSVARRRAFTAILALSALAQYGLVATHHKLAPYFLDQPTLFADILRILQDHDPRHPLMAGQSFNADSIRWLSTKNIAISGFDPNHALAYAWFFNPAIVFDLDLLEEDSRPGNWTEVNSFEDLFLLNAFNLYNRRCLWPHYFHTLDRETVLNHAEYILDGKRSSGNLAQRYPQHQLIQSLHAGRTHIHILRAITPPSETYRALFDEKQLAEREWGPDERAAIYYDLSMDALLRGDFERHRKWQEECATRSSPSTLRKNIYWTANGRRLQTTAERILSQSPANAE